MDLSDSIKVRNDSPLVGRQAGTAVLYGVGRLDFPIQGPLGHNAAGETRPDGQIRWTEGWTDPTDQQCKSTMKKKVFNTREKGEKERERDREREMEGERDRE